MRERVYILGVGVNKVTEEGAVTAIEGYVKDGKPHQVVTVNPEFVIMAQRDWEFKDLLNSSDLALPDGVGLLWASRFLGSPLPQRVTGVDMVLRLSSLAAEKGYRIFFLGGGEEVAKAVAQVVRSKFPGVTVVGTHAGSPSTKEEEDILARIRGASPDLLFVAYGAPQQDKWIRRNMHRLEVPVCMGVGGAFDFIGGVIRRAPPWMQRWGLEWLFRLIQEPWRWKRMLRLPGFVMLVWRERLLS
ncbi:MAG: WecB/TagA/CpsF family glycosyltransferase [Chloroflexi bacterium]|nr:WecB/TagA/CpsF family glycosyltransferase [Chloroflexota bacterium]